jgi:hypothetical protein
MGPIQIASETAGIIKCFQEPYPDAGSNLRLMLKTIIIIIPNQNKGMACPKMDNSVHTLSTHEPRLTALVTPNGTDNSKLISRAATVKSIVAGNRSKTIAKAGLLENKDTPKSPCTARERNFAY